MRVFRAILRVLLFIPLAVLVPFKVAGKENLPKKTQYVSGSNHLSMLDIALIWRMPRFKFFLAKKELAKNPFLRFFLWACGAIYIDRAKMDVHAIKMSVNSLKKAPLVIFPEGTRNKSGEDLQQVKGGASMIAVKAGVNVVPVMIHHKSRLFRKNYMYIAPPIVLPYSPKDRFNSEALQVCNGLLTDGMQSAKDFLDNLVTQKGFKEYKKKVKAEKKSRRRDASAALRSDENDIIPEGKANG